MMGEVESPSAEGGESETYRQPGQPGGGPLPEAGDALLGEDAVAAVDEVAVLGPGRERLHARLDHAVEEQGAGG